MPPHRREPSILAWQQRRCRPSKSPEKCAHRFTIGPSLSAERIGGYRVSPEPRSKRHRSGLNRGRLPDYGEYWRSRSRDCRATCGAGVKKIALVGRTACPIAASGITSRRPIPTASDDASVRARLRIARRGNARSSPPTCRARRMRRAIARVRAQFGRIAGVYHTAGTLADGLMLLKSDESALGVLRPEGHGTIVLHDALADDPPDYMVLFSSSVPSSDSKGRSTMSRRTPSSMLLPTNMPRVSPG